MENLVAQGIELAAFGMSTVFVFLAVLIFTTKAMSALILRIELEMVSGPAPAVKQRANGQDQGRLLAILSAAISQYRNSNK